jgi:hypothetical protein
MSIPISDRTYDPRVWVRVLFGFALATALGALVASYPLAVLGAAGACLALYGIFRWCHERLEFWQVLVLFALTPYLILNYGFDNLAVGAGGVQVPVGESLLFAALALLLGRQWWIVRSIMAEPSMVCLAALLLLSCAHLIVDVPRHGLYAVRDSSMFFEAVFLPLGVPWGINPRATQVLLRWMFFVFVLNLLYSWTFSWGEQIRAWSPASGVFHPVPLFGNYWQSAPFLLVGALFCIWLAPSLGRWPRWILVGLAAAQLGGLAILQARSMYVGILLVLMILLLLGESKKLAGFVSTLAWGTGVLAVLLLAVSVLGIEFQGRMGPVQFSFIADQAKTVLNVGDANARFSHEVDRSKWYGEVWDRVRSSPSNLIVGEGFGQALITFENEEGIPVRQPHNSSLTVLGRLGFAGLSMWVLFIILTALRYIRALRRGHTLGEWSPLILWLFLYFVLALLFTSVQPAFEFSHGAIPFYFFLGLTIGVLRNLKNNPGLPLFDAVAQPVRP